MNRPLLLSMAVASLLVPNLKAQSMLERFDAMEKEMNRLKQEITMLKASKQTTSITPTKSVSRTKVAEDDDEEDEDKPKKTAVAKKPEGAEQPAVANNAENDKKPVAMAKSNKKELDEPTVEERIDDIEESISEINRNTSGNHLKFNLDYRFAIENMNYKMADGSTAKNDAFMTNRLWMNMGYQATGNLSFSAQLAYNKAFGARSGASDPATASFESFDWIANENAYDDTLRVRSAYLFYKDVEFMGLDIPWTFSVGRRPSTNGHLVSLRDDDKESSPLGHSINVEFDGVSSQFMLNKATGTYVKFCAGRGMSNAAPKFSSTPYADVNNGTANSGIDLIGLIFVPYDNKQYSIATQYYYASNLIDVKNPTNYTLGFDTVGGMHSGTINFVAKGIGNKWNKFLDDTTLFFSAAMSVTDPKANQGMLGSADGESKTGTSYWIGTQFPSFLTKNGKWGLEYNHGSKYWRSITYGEDTNIGSKLAARGDAYEAYMTEYLIEDILSLQLRYTYIDYKYSGSNGFFGNTSGNSMTMDQAIGAGMGGSVVDKAQDIRLYLRYRF